MSRLLDWQPLAVRGIGCHGIRCDTGPDLGRGVELAKVDQNLQRPTSDLAATTELMVYDQRLFTEAPLDPIWSGRWRCDFPTSPSWWTRIRGRSCQVAQARSHDFDLDIQDAEHEATPGRLVFN